MTTDPTDEELNVEVAKALGWVYFHNRCTRDPWWMIPPNAKPYPLASYLSTVCDEWKGQICGGSFPPWATSADAALELVEAMDKRGFDVIIRRHNSGHWQCEFTEPSHEIARNAPTLPLAIVRAFLAAQGEGK